jgi:GH24 family phage-related lysozyme (muramidase)
MARHISLLAENRLTKPWEEYVGYPYDDKVPKRRGADGKKRYPEWTGGPVRGTITIGYGHTNAAGSPHIVPGMRMTEAEASQVLADDMEPCCQAVDRLVKVPLTQHQFDALSDAVFNFGAGTLRKSTLLKKLNAGNYDAVPAELMKYTYSKGEHMEGLVRRRQAEIAMWNMPDEHAEDAMLSPEDHGVDDDDVQCPKGDVPPPRSSLGLFDSKSVTSGGTIAATGVALISKANDAAEPIKQAQSNLQDLGLWDFITAHCIELGAVVLIVLGAFVVWDRIRHLHAERA